MESKVNDLVVQDQSHEEINQALGRMESTILSNVVKDDASKNKDQADGLAKLDSLAAAQYRIGNFKVRNLIR